VNACREIASLKDELHRLKSDNQDLTDENWYQPTHSACIVYLVSCLLWSPYVIGQTIIFLPCGFFLLSSTTCVRQGDDHVGHWPTF